MLQYVLTLRHQNSTCAPETSLMGESERGIAQNSQRLVKYRMSFFHLILKLYVNFEFHPMIYSCLTLKYIEINQWYVMHHIYNVTVQAGPEAIYPLGCV